MTSAVSVNDAGLAAAVAAAAEESRTPLLEEGHGVQAPRRAATRRGERKIETLFTRTVCQGSLILRCTAVL